MADYPNEVLSTPQLPSPIVGYDILDSISDILGANSTSPHPELVPTRSNTSRRSNEQDTILLAHFGCLAVILPVGIISNLLTITLNARSAQLRSTTTAHYLIFLAVADCLFLVSELLRWLNSPQFVPRLNFLHSHDLVCQSVYYVRYSSQLASAWLTVAIAVERCLTIVVPLKVAVLSTTDRARTLIIAIFAISFSLAAFPFWCMGIGRSLGPPRCEFHNRTSYAEWTMAVITVGALIIPSCLIFILTSIIIVCLGRARANRRAMQLVPSSNGFRGSSGSIALSGTNIDSRAAHAQRDKAAAAAFRRKPIERQLTAMLLAVAVAFLALRLPFLTTYYLQLYVEVLWKPVTINVRKNLFTLARVFDVFSISNYAINFFLYCLCGSTFRRQLKLCLSCRGSGTEGRSGNRVPLLTFTSSSVLPRASVASRQSVNLAELNFTAAGFEHHEKGVKQLLTHTSNG